jgi:hypothetical protein
MATITSIIVKPSLSAALRVTTALMRQKNFDMPASPQSDVDEVEAKSGVPRNQHPARSD